MQVITPTWQVPNNVHAFTTLRLDGVSETPFDSFNLGDHVGDCTLAVQKNRQRLVEKGNLPHYPLFLNQTHSTKVIPLPYTGTDLNADAAYTNQAQQVCLVMTADCLPVLFCNRIGTEIAAAHAGWRGLCNGILETTAKEFSSSMSDIQVWLGPAIGAGAFQVGAEVVEQFCSLDKNAINAFKPDPTQPTKFFGDLYLLARQRLANIGIPQVFGGEYCTYTQTDRFYSYRKEGKTGRMATLIWYD